MFTIYDTILSTALPHLQKYPNYLPYVSERYLNASLKILIVGESHYMTDMFYNKVDVNKWYDKDTDEVQTLKLDTSGMNTRKVIADFKTNRSLKAYRIFLNLEAAYSQVFISRNLFDECMFINYFQRPAEKAGASINANKKDHEVAYHNIKEIVQLLQPEKVIFVSRKAFDSFKQKEKKLTEQKLNYSKFNVVPHPSCTWWNKKSPRYGVNDIPSTGREKFIRLISKL